MSSYTLPPQSGMTLEEAYGFQNVGGGIPQGRSDTTLDRYAGGAVYMADLARRQLMENAGKTEAAYGQFTKPLESLMGRLNSLPQDLARSAIGSTAGAQMSAVNAARMAGNGGNVRAFAARGAVDAAVGQSAALANAMVQGRSMAAQYDAGIGSTLSSAYLQRAQMQERLYSRDAEMSFQIAQMLAGISAPGSQVDSAGVNKRTANQSSWIPNIGISLGGSNLGGS